MYTHTCIDMCLCMYVCISIYIYTYMYMYICIHIWDALVPRHQQGQEADESRPRAGSGQLWPGPGLFRPRGGPWLRPSESLGKPRFPLKGSFKGDICMNGLGVLKGI